MKKLKMGMVGGGIGAFIGEVHRKAARMDRLHGAQEALAFVRKLDFKSSAIAFDGAFGK